LSQSVLVFATAVAPVSVGLLLALLLAWQRLRQ
jgi:hypothetical protein